MESDDEKSLVASLLFDVPAVDDPFKVAREGSAGCGTARWSRGCAKLNLH
jgi:hypothetical protein